MRKIKIISLIAVFVMIASFTTACANKEAVEGLANELESLAKDIEDVGKELETTTQEILIAEGSLQEYYTKNDGIKAVNDQLEEMRATQYADVYKKMEFDVQGNMLIYTYTYVEGLTADASALKAELTDEKIEEQKDTIEAETGIRPSSIEFKYKEADGTQITSIKH